MRNIKLEDIGKWITKISDFINLNPKEWIKVAAAIGSGAAKAAKWLKNTGIGRKIGEAGSWLAESWVARKASRAYDKLIMGKINVKDIPNLINGGIKTLKDGLKGSSDFLKGVFTEMTPRAVKYWVHRSPWRMRKFTWLKKITNTPLYRKAQEILSPVIKRNSALHSAYNACKTVSHEYHQIKNTASTTM